MISILEFIEKWQLVPLKYWNRLSTIKTSIPTITRSEEDDFLLDQWADFRSVQNSLLAEKFSSNTFTPLNEIEPMDVCNENSLCNELRNHIFRHLNHVLSQIGFDTFFIEKTANLIGEPDFCFLNKNNEHPILTLEVKTPWATSKFDDLVAQYNIASKVTQAVQQVVGYMSINHHLYGVLTNYNKTWIFRREKTTRGEVAVVSVAGPFDRNEVFGAMLTVCVMALDNWFMASPAATPMLKRKAKASNLKSHSLHIDPDLNIQKATSHQIHFERGLAHHRLGSIVSGKIDGLPDCILKIFDLAKGSDRLEYFEHEVDMYRRLSKVQGKLIPRAYMYLSLWNQFLILVLENVGQHVNESQVKDETILTKMKNILDEFHKLGYTHGDIRKENFCVTETGQVRLIDLEMATKSDDKSTFSKEMADLMNCE